MHALLDPAGYALFIWWFSTGVVLLLDNLPRRTFPWSMTAGTVILAVALYRIGASASDTSVEGAYAAFTYGILAWAWQEMSFFMGFVTGPRRVAATPGASLGLRFRQGVAASIWHELAIIATAAAIVAATWHAPNQVATWTFMLLWLMRTSAKLNVFLGVLNLGEEFLPNHLRYLLSFMARRRMNNLMPVSIGFGALGTAELTHAALHATGAAPRADQVGLTFLATLLALAVIEHGFLILPLPFSKLWAWSLRFKPGRPKPAFNQHAQPGNAIGGTSHGLPAALP